MGLFRFCCLTSLFCCLSLLLSAQDSVVSKKDRKRDVLLTTNMGEIRIRLSDSTPMHRDNFLKLVKVHFYDSVLFHRVIRQFMIQGGDPDSRRAAAGQPLGSGDPGYLIPAEFRASLFHRKGAVAAARTNNPQKASSGSQFYIVQGRVFSPAGLDSVETFRLGGRKIPEEQRAIYTTIGGAPHLDQNYTVFGQVVKGLEIVDQIASVETSKAADRDRPVTDVRIIKARLVRRKRKL